jgi:hypothetical protein
MLLGSDGRPMLGPLGLRRLAGAPRIVQPSTTPMGADVLLEGPVAY